MCGVITLGVMQQIVRASAGWSWTAIVELISVYKRLRAFDQRIGGVAANARTQAASAN
jgi:ABC-type long-subunit fatty acid transport system fused permease/ATPase subunit